MTVTDDEAVAAVEALAGEGIDSGPCGAATLAGLATALGTDDVASALALGADSTVVLLNTESLRANPIPTRGDQP